MADDSVDDGIMETILRKKRCADIRSCGDFFIYLKQNPRTFVAATTVLSSVTIILFVGIAYSLKFNENICYFASGIVGFITNIYLFSHFRTFFSLKKEVDLYSINNKNFAKENGIIKAEVSRMKKAKRELKDTRVRIKDAVQRKQESLGKFRQLNVNLGTTGKQNLKVLGDLNQMASKMESKWTEQLYAKERKILTICFDQFPFENGKDGISEEQFKQFKMTLPMDYQLRLTQTGDWKSIAGSDGMLNMDEFIKVMDKFTKEKIEKISTPGSDL